MSLLPFSKSIKDIDGDIILAGSASNDERGDNDDGVDVSIDGPDSGFDNRSWSVLFPELLGDIIRRIESSEDGEPIRKNVVACASVCKSWREVTKGVVKSALESRKFTFPSCLMQAGPRDLPIQCLLTRNKKNSTFYLYLSLSPSITDKGKFLLAARRYRHGAHIEYIISLSADDTSQRSNNVYVGKIRSDFLGTNFRIYDSQLPQSGTKPCRKRFASKQISPQVVPATEFEIGYVTYKSNLLKSRGPRKMTCSMKGVDRNNLNNNKDDDHNNKMKQRETISSSSGYNNIVMKNKAPRWHEHIRCWCLNFHGRVTVASVKNFQLVTTVDQSQPGGNGGDGEKVVLQFGKVGEDTFTMDYREPLSAFQAFAICLTSFGAKLTWK